MEASCRSRRNLLAGAQHPTPGPRLRGRAGSRGLAGVSDAIGTDNEGPSATTPRDAVHPACRESPADRLWVRGAANRVDPHAFRGRRNVVTLVQLDAAAHLVSRGITRSGPTGSPNRRRDRPRCRTSLRALLGRLHQHRVRLGGRYRRHPRNDQCRLDLADRMDWHDVDPITHGGRSGPRLGSRIRPAQPNG